MQKKETESHARCHCVVFSLKGVKVGVGHVFLVAFSFTDIVCNIVTTMFIARLVYSYYETRVFIISKQQ